jgi:PAS domain S-box-containing protein
MPGELTLTAPASGDRTLLDLLWQAAEGAIILVDQNHRVLRANSAATAVMAQANVRVGDVMVDQSRDFCTLDGTSVPEEERPVNRALRGELVSREAFLVFYGEGDGPRRMELSAQPLELDNGTRGALLTWHDVTESWHFAERNRTELAQMGQLLEGASDYAIIMLDPAGRVQSWSPAAEAIHGYSATEAIGLPYAAFFDEADQATGLPKKILTKAAGRGKAQVEGKRVRRDGSVLWAHAVLTAIRDASGGLKGFVKVTHDVSEQRAAERAAVELNELLEERVAERTVQLEQQAADLAAVNAELEAFSYSVSHDLRAPLRAMNGFARIMEEELGDELSPGAKHYLGKVTENAQHMGSLIDALLSFSRMQRQSMRSAPIDMTGLVRECWSSLAWARTDREIDFVLPQLPAAMGDRRLIQQVWMNLLDNAIKYSAHRNPARIEVAAQIQRGISAQGDQQGGLLEGWVGDWADPDEVDDTVLYTVRDNGAGFDMRYVHKIGQVFQRLHHSDEFTGTGIGLALAQRIVQRHGGRMSAVGETGKGATFGFSLRATP